MREIPLTKGKVTVVDDADYEHLSRFKWSAVFSGKHWYAHRQVVVDGRVIDIKMHRFLLNPPADMVVDHIDRDGLNNQRSNLRMCTQANNLANSKHHRDGSSKFKGVTWDRHRSKWSADIMVEGKRFRLGRFKTEEQAAIAYDTAARKLQGKYARPNLNLTALVS